MTPSRSSSGLRYEWHVTPTERDDRFVVFDAASASLVRVGVDLDEIYQQNNRNVEPRARRGLESLAGRSHGLARGLRPGRGRTGHDGGQGYGRQSAVRRAAHGRGFDSARRRDR